MNLIYNLISKMGGRKNGRRGNQERRNGRTGNGGRRNRVCGVVTKRELCNLFFCFLFFF
jgi:hypothetical protein